MVHTDPPTHDSMTLNCSSLPHHSQSCMACSTTGSRQEPNTRPHTTVQWQQKHCHIHLIRTPARAREQSQQLILQVNAHRGHMPRTTTTRVQHSHAVQAHRCGMVPWPSILAGPGCDSHSQGGPRRGVEVWWAFAQSRLQQATTLTSSMGWSGHTVRQLVLQ